MTYNPFDFFRRNQKVLFAVLTVFIMFMFVLSSGLGRGDFFNWFPQWLGGMRTSGAVLAEIDGKEIKESMAADVRTGRYAANQFMFEVARKSTSQLYKYAESPQNRNKLSEQSRSVCEQASQINYGNVQRPDLRQMPQQFHEFMERQYQQQLSMVPMVWARANEMSLSSNADEARMGRIIRKLMVMTRKLGSNTERSYFVEMPIQNERDTIEFMLWKKKADVLGIKFTDEDINALMENEFVMLSGEEREQVIANFLDPKNNPQKNRGRKMLYQALGDEFRVQTAMKAVLGPVDIISMNLSSEDQRALLPYDYYKEYRDSTLKTNYAMIGVPVASFLSQVQGEPTDEEIKKIFNEHKNAINDPSNPKLGIREPRKIKLAWFEVNGKEKYFEDAIADAAVKNDVLNKITGALSAGAAPASAWSLITTTLYSEQQDPFLKSAYEDYRKTEQAKFARHLEKPEAPFTLNPVTDPTKIESNWYPPTENFVAQPNVAYALAGFGSYPLSTLAVPLVANANEIIFRQRNGWSQLSQALLPGLSDLSGFLASQAIYDLQYPKPLPFDTVRTELVKGLKENMRTTVLNSELKSFEDELQKIMNPKDKPKDFDVKKAESQALEFVNKYKGTAAWKDKDGKDQLGRNVKYGEGSEPRDLFTISSDPKLASITDALSKFFKAHGSDYVDPARIYAFMFQPVDRATGGKFAPQRFSASLDGTTYVLWRVEDEAPTDAKNPNEAKVRKACVDIWKMKKARELAKAAAEKFAEKCNDKLGTTTDEISRNLTTKVTEFAQAEFTDPELRRSITQFEFKKPVVLIDTAGTSFNLANEMGERLRFPSQEMQNALITSRSKPLSTAFTVADMPERMYYVAVITGQTFESAASFSTIAYGPFRQPNGPLSGIGYNTMAQSYRFQRELALSMLKAEFSYKNENKELLNKETRGSE